MTPTPRRLPIVDDSFLDNVRIATPCHADWSQMAGDDRVRHCGDCRLNVYDVSQMTRAEAAALIRMNEGKRVCMRLYKRPDGTLITQDCWERLRAARRRGWIAFAAALVLVGLTQLGLRFAALGWLMKISGERGMGAIEAPREPVTPTLAAPPVVETPPCPLPRLEEREVEMGKVAPPPTTERPIRKVKPLKVETVLVAPTMGDISVER